MKHSNGFKFDVKKFPEQEWSAADFGFELLRVVGQHALQQDHGGHDIHRQAVRDGTVWALQNLCLKC